MARFPTYPTLYDEVKTLSISSLKKWGYLAPSRFVNGTVTWSSNGQRTGSISISVDTIADPPWLLLDYLVNGKVIKYKVYLVSVPSNLGKGRLWYFLCPQTGKRCRKLYCIDGYFLHRTAFQGCMYEQQTYSKGYRNFGKILGITIDEKFMKLYNESKKPYYKMYYKGKPTKKYRRLLLLGNR